MDYFYIFLGVVGFLGGLLIFKYPKRALRVQDFLRIRTEKDYSEKSITNVKFLGAIVMFFGLYMAVSILVQLIRGL